MDEAKTTGQRARLVAPIPSVCQQANTEANANPALAHTTVSPQGNALRVAGQIHVDPNANAGEADTNWRKQTQPGITFVLVGVAAGVILAIGLAYLLCTLHRRNQRMRRAFKGLIESTDAEVRQVNFCNFFNFCIFVLLSVLKKALIHKFT